MKVCTDCKTVNLPHRLYCRHCMGDMYRSKTKQMRQGPPSLLDKLLQRPT